MATGSLFILPLPDQNCTRNCHRQARVFIESPGNRAVIRNQWLSHRTPRIATLMRQSPSRSNLPTPAWWILERIALGAPTQQRVVVAPDLDERERLSGAAQRHAPTDRCAVIGRRALPASRRDRHSRHAHALTTPAPATALTCARNWGNTSLQDRVGSRSIRCFLMTAHHCILPWLLAIPTAWRMPPMGGHRVGRERSSTTKDTAAGAIPADLAPRPRTPHDSATPPSIGTDLHIFRSPSWRS